MDTEYEAAIRAAEKRRCAAMLESDRDALSGLLDQRLQFSHATGAVDGKDAYLAKMSAGRIRYIDIAWSDEKVTALAPEAAILTGRMVTDVLVDGTEKRLNNRVLTVWYKSDEVWRLIAFQSTPLAA